MRQFLSLSVLSIVPISFIFSCASLPAVGGGDRKVAIVCQGSNAIREHRNLETKIVYDKGPVLLSTGMDCSKASKLDEKDQLALKKEGNWQQFNKETGVLMSEGTFANDKREGEFKYYTDKKELFKSTYYRDGKKDGPETLFFAGSGEWREKGQNVADDKSGEWQIRPSLKSECISIGNFNKGEKTGGWKECSLDEKNPSNWYLGFEGAYQQGMKDGPAKHLHSNGQTMAAGNYRADFVCKENPPQDGGVDACGKRTGEWKVYFDDGKLAMTGSYDSITGKRTGIWTEYYKSGQKMASGPREHTRTGLWTFFDKNGSILSSFRFAKNDFMANGAVLYSNGRKIGEGPLTTGLVKYDAAKDEMIFSTLTKTGSWTEYNEAGQKVGEGAYTGGKKNGEWKELENGKWVTKKYMMGLPK